MRSYSNAAADRAPHERHTSRKPITSRGCMSAPLPTTGGSALGCTIWRELNARSPCDQVWSVISAYKLIHMCLRHAKFHACMEPMASRSLSEAHEQEMPRLWRSMFSHSLAFCLAALLDPWSWFFAYDCHLFYKTLKHT